MLIKDKLSCARSVLQCRMFKERIPIAVRWQLTNRCTLNCVYCNIWNTRARELSYEEIVKVIDELSRIGTKRISFSGGEPLLREDISQIISYCRDKNIYPEMNSNGTLIADNIDSIRGLDFLKLSLDGPEQAHDLLRGKGSYRKVINAADACLKEKIKFGFACTLTKHNINKLDFMLELAGKYETIVAFQPIKKIYRGVEDISEFVPEEKDFKQAIEKLIKIKYKSKNIRNSLMGLHHIYNWPRYKKLKCWAGKIFCIIETNGDVYPCDRITYKQSLPNCRNMSMKDALRSLPEINCEGCGFCGSLELNYLMSFRINVLRSIQKILS